MSYFEFINRRKIASEFGPTKSAQSTADYLAEIDRCEVGMFWATDGENKLVYLSPGARETLGNQAESILGLDIGQVFKDPPFAGEDAPARPITFKFNSRSEIKERLVEIEIADEKINYLKTSFFWKVCAKPFFDEKGDFGGYRGVASDVTQQTRKNRDLAKQSRHDELTGLANRRFLEELIAGTLRKFAPVKRSCALLMLDLDYFKQINDVMGHPAGDELLRQVSDRLTGYIRERGTVGRLGGDEFQILVPDIDDRSELTELAEGLIQIVSQPYKIDGRRAVIGTSVGIAIAPYDGINVAESGGAVDLALYGAKANGKGTYCFFTPDMKSDAADEVMIQGDLRDALEKGQLYLAYQPLVDPRSNRIKCLEALMRWKHPEKGAISPEKFIPIAEQTDLILKIGEWAIRQACANAVEWPGELNVAVNVSARQFAGANLPEQVAAALSSSGLSPRRLELEITESVFVGNVKGVDRACASIDKMGVSLTMDDFGTGYSSLGYLKRAPFKKIKIDQSFVRGCTASGDTNPAIITDIVSLAKALGMKTVAEGVEAMDELELVAGRGADLVQGWIYSKPLTHDELLKRLKNDDFTFVADGPLRYRDERTMVYRNVGAIQGDYHYDVVLKNISRTGARLNGLEGIPAGSEVIVDLGGGQFVVGKIVYTGKSGQGIAFETPLVDDGRGGLVTPRRISPYSLAAAGVKLEALQQSKRHSSRAGTDRY
ncbi:MAG: EAL domain-containing protein [Paracoccaceae bacterium]